MQEALPTTGPRIARVGEVLARVRGAIREAVPPLWIAGEVSNLRAASSGHVYFTLKDGDAQLRCALFRRDAARVPFAVEDGLEVLAFGEVGVYEARGDLQLVVRQMEPRGQGALQLAFEQLRTRLAAEGLFDDDRKRVLPRFPRCIGVVTSTSGAALHDMVRVLRERGPALRLLVAPARVQGVAADLEIVTAMQQLVAQGDAELVVLARGGGSLEDLWCFNSEALARAIARCPVPVATGIGHETDLCIADLVADASAPTPSALAAQVAPDREWWGERLTRLRDRGARATAGLLEKQGMRVAALRRSLRGLSPRAQLATRRERLGALAGALRSAAQGAAAARRARLGLSRARLANAPTAIGIAAKHARVAASRAALETAAGRALRDARAALALAAASLDTLSPLAVLGRGYAIARRRSDGRILRAPEDVETGEEVSLRLAGGELAARITGRLPADD